MDLAGSDSHDTPASYQRLLHRLMVRLNNFSRAFLPKEKVGAQRNHARPYPNIRGESAGCLRVPRRLLRSVTSQGQSPVSPKRDGTQKTEMQSEGRCLLSDWPRNLNAALQAPFMATADGYNHVSNVGCNPRSRTTV